MRNTLYSTLYSLLKKGDVERRTIFPDKVALYQKGEEKYKEGDGDWENPDLIENIKPEPHLVIFGAGHVSKAIAKMAQVLEMKVTVIDEREEVLNRDRFNHGEELILEPYSSFLKKESPFFRPYYIIVTHGHAYDRACLEWCLKSNYAYLGMIGSKGKVATTFSLLKENGFNVIHTHIFDGHDFFEQEVPDCDYIISNPPYSLKGEVFSRLYEIGKPFAMLINFQGIFDHKDRFELFKNHRVEMMWLSPRVNYIKENGSKPSGVPFQSGYLCSGICEKQLEFEYLDKNK